MNNSIGWFSRYFLCVLVLVISILGLSSCELIYVGDQKANTPGYKIFEGKDEGFRIRFEYPDSWKRDALDNYNGFMVLDFGGLKTMALNVISELNTSNGGQSADAGTAIQHDLDIYSKRPEYNLLSHQTIKLGQIECHEVIYTFRFIFDDQHAPRASSHIDKNKTIRTIAADKQTRIYRIDLVIDTDDYERIRPGFEHMISTFRFLD
jgi:hypothetical protein